jgi:S1-C subfamily serine protease
VNIYTTMLEERRAEIGVSPNEVLPFRIPLVSAVLDIVPFKVPIPFQTEGFSLGSGFLINREGYILTNAHVVRNATDVRVVRTGVRKEFPARIIGRDRLTDTALLKIDAQPDMAVLPLGDSDALEVGEMVVAVGNPLGLRHTVTSGLVSAKERIVPSAENTLVDFLQTDSAINPGSSGGPLLNLHGEVVGINTAMVSEAQSIGFAIPINSVKRVMPLLIVGKTERGWFGASARPFAPGEARSLGYPNPSAVVIDGVAADGPAAASGVRPADVIVAIDGQPIADFVAFRRELIGRLPGQKLRLLVSRGGELIEFESVLAPKPDA